MSGQLISRQYSIVDYIITNHNRKTHNRKFTAIFCVASVATLIEYYQIFLAKQEAGEHDLQLATIFSYGTNEDDKDAVGFIEDEEFSQAAEPEPTYTTLHTRDHLEHFIKHYNQQFNTNFTTKDSQSFYNYYNDIARRVKHQQIDVLLVVNMFLTGFDSKKLNTLYVDKNLKYHGLIQAYSRTNRILSELKSQGNVVCFRNLKKATDEAVSLFSDKNAKETIIIAPYEEYVAKFNLAYQDLIQIAPTIDSVNELVSEEDKLAFIKAFRALIRLKNVLKTFTQFTHDDLSMDAQTFEDYKSKYLDLHDKAKSQQQKEVVSILNDIDFELELIHRDQINVTYILKLLAQLKEARTSEREKQRKIINDLLAGDTQLRSKRELIEKFIQENLPHIVDSDDIPEEFERFWTMERLLALQQLSKEEQLDSQKLEAMIGAYLFTEKQPLRDDIINMMLQRPSLKKRKSTAERITQKIMDFIETFINGVEM